MATAKKSTKTKKGTKTLQELQKGDTIYLYMFSGAPAGAAKNGNAYEVAACNDKTIMVETKSGKKKFSRATGVQVGADNPRYSNFITSDPDDADAREAAKDVIRGMAPAPAPAKKKAKKPATKKAAAEEVDEDEFEDAAEEDEAPAPKKKAPAKKKPAAKKKAAPPPEEDDDDDDFDDDDFDEDDE